MSDMQESKKNVIETETEEVSSSRGENYEPTKWENFFNALSVQKRGDLTVSQLFLYNPDLKPVEEKRRKWAWFNFVFFWIADSFNVNTWQIAATGVAAGLSWYWVWVSVWLGYFITGCFVTLAARMGAFYHVSFPVAARSSFGVFGSIWPVINRVVMACVWYGVQSTIGGNCVRLMLESIFGTNLESRISSAGAQSTTTGLDMLAFFLFWAFSLPAIWFPPHQIRHLFTVKAYVVVIGGIAFLAWTIVKADGIGPVVHQHSTLHGSEFAWAFIDSTMNCIANFATLIVNAPDFSRFAKTKNSAIWSQLLSIPLCFAITSLIGILVSSASTVMYGTTEWSPLAVLGRFLDDFSSRNRAGVFFISLAFAIAQLGTNISANSLSAGTDMTALLPQFINIRRGGYVCALVAFAICPWNLMTSSNQFTTYLSAYSVFLSSIAGCVAADYFVVRRGFINIPYLYSAKAEGYYTFNKIGTNWRAYVAYICGILPNIVGFAGQTGREVPIGALYVYRLNFFAGYIVSFSIYLFLCWLSPVKGMPMEKEDMFKKGWHEKWADVEDFDEIMTSGRFDSDESTHPKAM